MNTGHHQSRREAFAGGIANHQRQAIIGERRKIVAIAPERANLPALSAVVEGAGVPAGTLHKPLLHMAGKHPILANVNHHIFGRHFPTSTLTSVQGAGNRQSEADFCFEKYFPGM